jgi:hypothetical protein
VLRVSENAKRKMMNTIDLLANTRICNDSKARTSRSEFSF